MGDVLLGVKLVTEYVPVLGKTVVNVGVTVDLSFEVVNILCLLAHH